jgi:hypothetical protein
MIKEREVYVHSERAGQRVMKSMTVLRKGWNLFAIERLPQSF